MLAVFIVYHAVRPVTVKVCCHLSWTPFAGQAVRNRSLRADRHFSDVSGRRSRGLQLHPRFKLPFGSLLCSFG